MVSRNTHPFGKPAGLSPADLQRHAEPAAYLTRAELAERAESESRVCRRSIWHRAAVQAWAPSQPQARPNRPTRRDAHRQVVGAPTPSPRWSEGADERVPRAYESALVGNVLNTGIAAWRDRRMGAERPRCDEVWGSWPRARRTPWWG
jgi:hypothetical protein